MKKKKREYTRNHDCKNLKKQYWKRLEVETLDIINISQLQFTIRIYKHNQIKFKMNHALKWNQIIPWINDII